MKNCKTLISLTGSETAALRAECLSRLITARMKLTRSLSSQQSIKQRSRVAFQRASTRSVQSSSRSHLAATNSAAAPTAANVASPSPAPRLHELDVTGALNNDQSMANTVAFRCQATSDSLRDDQAPKSRGNDSVAESQLEAHKFMHRHIGPREQDLNAMLAALGYNTIDELIEATIPEQILLDRDLRLPEPLSEAELLDELRSIAAENTGAREWRSFIGLGYYDCHTPPVILRNMFENPGWTTAYTAYQAEIAQGRLESLMNYQTMVCDLTGMDVANASLLDEATAAAEAMQVCLRHDKLRRNKLLISNRCHPQTIAVVETRAQALEVHIDFVDELSLLAGGDGRKLEQEFKLNEYSGLLVQYPNTHGHLFDLDAITKPCREAQCLVVVATDLLACTLFKPPGDFEHPADLAVGSSQRLGIPLNYGGPHAGFLACRQSLVRSIPGRVVGLTRDSQGDQAYRFALQTREQHIRRDKATSNICTAQALLANMSAMYAVLHGPDGLREISSSIHAKTSLLAELIKQKQHQQLDEGVGKEASGKLQVEILNDGSFFDTLTLRVSNPTLVKQRAQEAKINLRYSLEDKQTVCISLDETTKLRDVVRLANLFHQHSANSAASLFAESAAGVAHNANKQPIYNQLAHLKRTSSFLTHPTFNQHKSEAQLVRYMKSLENKDVSLTHSMIPLGSCTMKLNATSQIVGSSWPEFAKCHPFQPTDQCGGYMRLIKQLEDYLCEVTGYDRISFQPNSGAQGEYAGLRVIKSYLESRGETERKICLIPISAHGTNPASAQMAGFKIQTIKVREDGNIDLEDLKKNIEKHRAQLACLMITYPSTFGVFEDGIREMCAMVHESGGQVYLDGANMNAQVGLCRPGDYGSDVSHLNLHKTFCIPHGGGGPGAGPIGVKSHLVPFLPKHPLVEEPANEFGTAATGESFGTVSASMWGSPAILPISWSYIRLMSSELKKSSQVAILNANYMRRRLENDYKILFKGTEGNVAHEFIIDCRPFKRTANVEASDIAKRLQDFGLHAPTVSWPVTNTLMLEPTESEDKAELDRYCEALLAIRREIAKVESGEWDTTNNPIKNAPHTQKMVCSSEWSRPYSREQAAYPASFVTPTTKFWPTVGRVDDIYGDTNLFCTCAPVESSDEQPASV